MTHIILLDGKLWAFEPPEKPIEDNYPNEHAFRFDLEAYNRAYSLALEQKIEVEPMDEKKQFQVALVLGKLLKENEPIKWEGRVLVLPESTPIPETDDSSRRKKVARLIAPVKEEKLSDNEVIAGVERMLSESQNNVDSDQKKKGSENTPTPEEMADWDRPKSKPVPSEQEKQSYWNHFNLPSECVFQLQRIALADDEMVKQPGAAEVYRDIVRDILKSFTRK